MKKTFLILICFVLLFVLCSCGGINSNQRNESIEYAESNLEELQSCGQELIAILSAKNGSAGLSYKVELRGSRLRLYDYLEETEEEIESDLCRKILSGGRIDCIIIHLHKGNWSVEFSCGGYGIGPNTGYYDIQYIPSGEVDDLWFYDRTMTYDKQDKGYMGRETNGDNTFYYYQISKFFFYTEATF